MTMPSPKFVKTVGILFVACFIVTLSLLLSTNQRYSVSMDSTNSYVIVGNTDDPREIISDVQYEKPPESGMRQGSPIQVDVQPTPQPRFRGYDHIIGLPPSDRRAEYLGPMGPVTNHPFRRKPHPMHDMGNDPIKAPRKAPVPLKPPQPQTIKWQIVTTIPQTKSTTTEEPFYSGPVGKDSDSILAGIRKSNGTTLSRHAKKLRKSTNQQIKRARNDVGRTRSSENTSTTSSSNGQTMELKNSEPLVVIVGAGLSGAVMAHLHATILKKQVLIIEKRNHVAGNCFDYTNKYGIRMSKYGAHLFHTKYDRVWNFVTQFSNWTRYHHRVVGKVDDYLVPIPVNIDTANILVPDTNVNSPEEMKIWLEKTQLKFKNVTNSEQAALGRVGQNLYDKMFKPYTLKQWHRDPKDLDASVLQRIPVRDDYDDRYFPADPNQALPSDGYTNFIANIMKDAKIKIILSMDYFDWIKTNKEVKVEKLIFTGPIDQYFADAGLPKLEYRSLKFEEEDLPDVHYHQSSSVVNYPQSQFKFTRILEYKHVTNTFKRGTTIVKEFPSDTGDPYYPVPNQKNRNLYQKYAELAAKEEKKKGVFFLGRLANYKYFNMDQAILNALKGFEKMYGYKEDQKLFQKPSAGAKDLKALWEEKITFSVVVSAKCDAKFDSLALLVSDICAKHPTTIFVYESCQKKWDSEKSTKRVKELKKLMPKCLPKYQLLDNAVSEFYPYLFHLLYRSFDFSQINLFLIAPEGSTGVSKDLVETAYTAIKSLGDKSIENPRYRENENTNTTNRKLANHFQVLSKIKCVSNDNSLKEEFAQLICGKKPGDAAFKKQLTSLPEKVASKDIPSFFATEAFLRRVLSKSRTFLVKLARTLDDPKAKKLNYEQLWGTILMRQAMQDC